MQLDAPMRANDYREPAISRLRRYEKRLTMEQSAARIRSYILSPASVLSHFGMCVAFSCAAFLFRLSFFERKKNTTKNEGSHKMYATHSHSYVYLKGMRQPTKLRKKRTEIKSTTMFQKNNVET